MSVGQGSMLARLETLKGLSVSKSLGGRYCHNTTNGSKHKGI